MLLNVRIKHAPPPSARLVLPAPQGRCGVFGMALSAESRPAISNRVAILLVAEELRSDSFHD